MREYVNPFQTYNSFGKERWERVIGEITAKQNRFLARFPTTRPKIVCRR